MRIDGSCHCGQIAFEAEVDPEMVGICHCTDCQALSASAFRTVAIAAADKFSITRGSPREYVKTSASGNARAQAFCGNCGAALYATDAGDDRRAYNIRVGTVRQRRELAPRFECWTQSAMPWLPEFGGTRKFDHNPEF